MLCAYAIARRQRVGIAAADAYAYISIIQHRSANCNVTFTLLATLMLMPLRAATLLFFTPAILFQLPRAIRAMLFATLMLPLIFVSLCHA